MRNEEVVRILNALGDLLEIKGETRFRVNAYRDAARQIEGLSEDLNVLAAEGRLRAIPGVGEAIALKVQELLNTGQLGYFERLKAEVPETLLELVQVPGLGPRKIKLLYESLGVKSIADLRVALADGRVATLPGMGARSVENLKREVERWEQRGSRVPLGSALPLVQDMMAALRAQVGSAILRMEEAGSVRRRRDTIGDLDILVATEEPARVLDAFVALPQVQEVVGRGDTKASVLGPKGQQIDLRVVPVDSWGAALQYFTGSKAHNVRLREIAVRKGWRLN